MKLDPSSLELIYQTTISEYRLPDVVTATRPSELSANFEGSDRSIHHDQWLIRLEDPKLRRKRDCWINFDSVVHVDAMRLSSPQLRHDYLVKKILIISVLTGIFDYKITSESFLKQYSRQYDWFVRWRLGLDLWQNDKITKNDFNRRFVERLDRGDVLLLIPLEQRIEHFTARVDGGDINLSNLLYRRRPKELLRLNWPILGDHLGVTHLSLSSSPTFKALFVDCLGSIDSPEARYVAELIVQAGGREPEGGSESEPGGGSESELARRTIANRFRVWRHLHDLSARGVLPINRLTFDPMKKRTARQLSRSISKKEGRTLTLHPDDFYRLLKESMRWAFKYAEYILAALDLLRQNTALYSGHPFWKEGTAQLDAMRPEGAPSLYLAWHNNGRLDIGDRITVTTATKLLMSSCALVIGCFAARRGKELEDLLRGCVNEVRPGIFLLTVFIEKTRRDIDHIPVPKAVKTAVSILERLNDAEMVETGIDGTASSEGVEPSPAWLFHVQKRTGRIGFQLSPGIQEFVEFVQLPPPAGTEAWDLASHMLRRGWAIWCFYGNPWSTLEEVTEMLGHLDPAVARIYLTEAIVGEISRLEDELRARAQVAREHMPAELSKWFKATEERIASLHETLGEFDEVNNEAYVYRMMSLHKRTDNAIGKGAKRVYADLERLVEQAMADVRIVSRSNDQEAFEGALMDRIKANAVNRSLLLVPGGVAHCGADPNDPADVEVAECVKAKVAFQKAFPEGSEDRKQQIDYAFSGAYACITCEHCVALRANQEVHETKIKTIGESVATAPSAAAAADRKKTWEKYRDAYLKAKAVGEAYA